MFDKYAGKRDVRELESPSAIERYCKRVVALALKGWKCAKCGERPTWRNVRLFEFDHDEEVNDGSSMDTRWTSMRHRPLEEIIEWLPTVTVHCIECHDKRHRKQLFLDLAVQERIDTWCETND